MKIKLFFAVIIFSISGCLSAQMNSNQVNMSQGEKLFKENKPKEAVQVLENELLNGIISGNTYNFLGLGYYQLGKYSDSIDAFNRGIKAQPDNIKILSYNQGNTYYTMKDFTSAVSCFSRALNEDSTFYDALLNRANSLLMSEQLEAAKSDYIDFVEKCPEDPQKPQIKKLIQALTEEIARREEEKRLLKEQNKTVWEEVDPSFEELSGEEIQWEKIDASIDNVEDDEKPLWEGVDTRISDQEEKKKNVDWEGVDSKITETDAPKKSEDWEIVENSQNKLSDYNKNTLNDEQLEFEKQNTESENKQTDWEKLESEKMNQLPEYDKNSETIGNDLQPDWENLSDEETLELKRLDEQSRKEYEKWLEEQSIIRQRKAEEELKRIQQKNDEERLSREKLMEDIMKAEEARRKKLLDDVANSLQSGNSTNMSSGTDELLEYDLEGELD